jgi:LemA protein
LQKLDNINTNYIIKKNNPYKMKKFSYKAVIAAVVVLFLIWTVGSYNGLVQAQISVENSWAEVENTFQSRFDLVPNLQSIVQGAANFEQETFTQVTEARNQFNSAGSREEQIAAGNQFDSAISRLLVTVEAYPQLTATQGFQTFQSQLEGIENRVRVARRDYNSSVTTYNTKIRTFPSNLLAGILNFDKEEFFEAATNAENAPQIDFTK